MTVSDTALLQFRPCHVYLPSSREYYLIFRPLRDLEQVPLKVIWTKLGRSKPKSIKNNYPYKFREYSGWLIFGLWMGVNIVNVYILSVLWEDFLLHSFSSKPLTPMRRDAEAGV